MADPATLIMGGGLLAGALGGYLGSRASSYYPQQLEEIARRQRELARVNMGRVAGLASGMAPVTGQGPAGEGAKAILEEFVPRPDPRDAAPPPPKSGAATTARGAALGGAVAAGQADAEASNRMVSFRDNLALADINAMPTMELMQRDAAYSAGLQGLAQLAAQAQQSAVSESQGIGSLLSGIGSLMVMYGGTMRAGGVSPTARERIVNAALGGNRGRLW